MDFKPQRRNSSKISGLTIFEVLIAATIFTLGIMGAYIVSSQCLQISVTSRNLSLASHILEERSETLRNTLFLGSAINITSGSLQTLLANPTFSGTASTPLTGTETIKIYAFSGTTALMTGTRSISATSATVTSGTATSPVKVELKLDWSEHSGGKVRAFSRSASTVISNTN